MLHPCKNGGLLQMIFQNFRNRCSIVRHCRWDIVGVASFSLRETRLNQSLFLSRAIPDFSDTRLRLGTHYPLLLRLPSVRPRGPLHRFPILPGLGNRLLSCLSPHDPCPRKASGPCCTLFNRETNTRDATTGGRFTNHSVREGLRNFCIRSIRLTIRTSCRKLRAFPLLQCPGV